MALNYTPISSKNKLISSLVSGPQPLNFTPYVNNGNYVSSVLNNTKVGGTTTPAVAKSAAVKAPVAVAAKPVATSTPAATYGVPGATPLNSPAKDAYIKSIAGQTGGSTTAQYNAAAGPTTPTTPAVPAAITGNTTTPSGAVINVTTGQTVSGPAVDPNQRYTDAYNQYINSLLPSSAETQAQKRLSDLNLQAQRDQEKALNSGETSGFASGEAARVNRNNQFDIDAASNALSALTGTRTATTSAAKARADFEQSLLKDNEPQKIGDSILQKDPVTGAYKEVYTAPKTATAPKIIGNTKSGYYTVDESGNLSSLLGPAPVAAKSTSSSSGSTKSGSLVYSNTSYGQDSQALENSRGADGYVDPNIYKNLYSAWVKNGGTITGFLSKFPPKNYVNPANNTLPPALRSASSKTSLEATIDSLF